VLVTLLTLYWFTMPFAGSAEGEVLSHQLNITDPSSVNSFTQWFKEKFGHVDILVNNAGAERVLRGWSSGLKSAGLGGWVLDLVTDWGALG
jgi:NAD(P)-dependent dehydrogenase (short-subunit alcohol dehydrogenase family)